MRFPDYLKRFTYTPNDFYDYLKRMEDMVSGDVKAVIVPAADDAMEVEASDMDGFIQTITVQIVKNDGTVHDAYQGTLNVQVVNGSTAGTVAINDEDAGAAGANVDDDILFENGAAVVLLTYGGTWEADETVKINVDKDDVEVCGYAVKVSNHTVLTVIADEE
jgi:hypothetical protein